MPPAGLEPALCLQKGILSPSCLPASGGYSLLTLIRFIFTVERDFSVTTERDFSYFECIIAWIFSPVNWIFVKVNTSIISCSIIAGSIDFTSAPLRTNGVNSFSRA